MLKKLEGPLTSFLVIHKMEINSTNLMFKMAANLNGFYNFRINLLVLSSVIWEEVFVGESPMEIGVVMFKPRTTLNSVYLESLEWCGLYFCKSSKSALAWIIDNWDFTCSCPCLCLCLFLSFPLFVCLYLRKRRSKMTNRSAVVGRWIFLGPNTQYWSFYMITHRDTGHCPQF